MPRYRHPKHGFHIVSYGDDLAALEAAGWVPDVASEPAPPPELPAPAAERAPDPEPPARRGPGRPRKAW